jgi:hypothetical protein
VLRFAFLNGCWLQGQPPFGASSATTTDSRGGWQISTPSVWAVADRVHAGRGSGPGLASSALRRVTLQNPKTIIPGWRKTPGLVTVDDAKPHLGDAKSVGFVACGDGRVTVGDGR